MHNGDAYRETESKTFWNKFEAEIDKTGPPAVTKFAYLKELVDPRVRKGIDGLHFTSEGYERAKNILQTNYGQTSEIINARGEGKSCSHNLQSGHPAWWSADNYSIFPTVNILEARIEANRQRKSEMLKKLKKIISCIFVFLAYRICLSVLKCGGN